MFLSDAIVTLEVNDNELRYGVYSISTLSLSVPVSIRVVPLLYITMY